jgi:alkylation response protein AidB-like acyl-CoA dehydrogenase
MAVRVTNQAMQLHGGNGYTTERRIERYWRDARLTTIFEGTSESNAASSAIACSRGHDGRRISCTRR